MKKDRHKLYWKGRSRGFMGHSFSEAHGLNNKKGDVFDHF
jgi:hypothetical protein